MANFPRFVAFLAFATLLIPNVVRAIDLPTLPVPEYMDNLLAGPARRHPRSR